MNNNYVIPVPNAVQPVPNAVQPVPNAGQPVPNAGQLQRDIVFEQERNRVIVNSIAQIKNLEKQRVLNFLQTIKYYVDVYLLCINENTRANIEQEYQFVTNWVNNIP